METVKITRKDYVKMAKIVFELRQKAEKVENEERGIAKNSMNKHTSFFVRMPKVKNVFMEYQ